MRIIYISSVTLLLATSCLCAGVTAATIKIAVFPFDVKAQEDLSYLRDGVSALLPSRLTVPGKIAVFDIAHMPNTMSPRRDSRSASGRRQLAEGTGAHYMLTGRIIKTGTAVNLDARLAGLQKQSTPAPISVQTDNLNNIIPAITALAQKIRDIILSDEQLPAPPASAKSAETSNPSALRPREPEPDNDRAASSETPPVGNGSSHMPVPQASPDQPVPGRIFGTAPFFTFDITGRPLSFLASGDMEGDGVKELIVAGNDDIYVYSVTESELLLRDEIDVELDENIIHVEAGDVNGNGRDEVYASSYDGRHPNSFVAERTGKSYQRSVRGQRWFFRTLRTLSSGTTLLGQEAVGSDPFSGPMYHIVWQDAKLVPRDEVVVPGGSGIYGFTEADIDADADSEYIAFSRGLFSSRFCLTVYSYAGRVEWRDFSKLGGAPVFFEKTDIAEAMTDTENIPLRILCDDIDADGRPEIIVARNSKKGKGLLNKLQYYNQGVVECLNWTGSELHPRWTSCMLEGYVSDYIVEDFDGDNRRELYILSVAPQGFFGKALNRITMFRQAPDTP